MDSKVIVAIGAALMTAIVGAVVASLFLDSDVRQRQAAELTAKLPATNEKIDNLDKRVREALAQGESERKEDLQSGRRELDRLWGEIYRLRDDVKELRRAP